MMKHPVKKSHVAPQHQFIFSLQVGVFFWEVSNLLYGTLPIKNCAGVMIAKHFFDIFRGYGSLESIKA